jgi:hypothetical protein
MLPGPEAPQLKLGRGCPRRGNDGLIEQARCLSRRMSLIAHSRRKGASGLGLVVENRLHQAVDGVETKGLSSRT